jgi:hypothetical protein
VSVYLQTNASQCMLRTHKTRDGMHEQQVSVAHSASECAQNSFCSKTL